MTVGDDKQTCPFCNADWGTCEHYRLLSEWEAEATSRETGRVGRTHSAKSEPVQPVSESRIEGE